MSSDTAMIAFLPTNAVWVKQDFPHMTLVYAGPITGRNQSDFNAMSKDGISAARTVGGSFSLNVVGVETLGDAGEEVDVLTLYPTPQLLLARQIVEKWDASEFPHLPHVTIGPAGSAYAERVVDSGDEYSYSQRKRNRLPSVIHFDQLAIAWGNDRLLFNLNTYDY